MENQNHVHTFVDTVVPASCKQQGYTQHRCVCGYEYKDHFVPAGNHRFELKEQTEPACAEAGSQRLVCSLCGEEQTRTVPATGHKLTGGQKSKTEKGVREYFCQNCGQTVKKKTSFHKFKKLIVALSVLLVLSILAAVFFPILTPHYYHYTTGKRLLNKGEYEKAYSHLVDCKEYKDTEELLKGFLVICEIKKVYYKGEFFGKTIGAYDPNTNKVIYTNYAANEKKTGSTEEIYDKDGNLVRSTSYDANGKLDYKIEYIYDKDGNQISFASYDANGKLEEKTEFNYDNDGNLVRSTSYDAQRKLKEKTEFTYDKDGNQISSASYDAQGKLKEKTEFTYDKNGIHTGTTRYDADEKLTDKYAYDKDGSLTSYASYDANGNPKFKHKYTYDEDGNQTNFAYYDANGNIQRQYTYKDYQVFYLG